MSLQKTENYFIRRKKCLVETTDKEKVIQGLSEAIKGLNNANNYIYAHDKSGHKKVRKFVEMIWKLEGQLK